MKFTLNEIGFALGIVQKLNQELETQDFVEEQFTLTTNGSCMWVEFSGERIFDSHDEKEDEFDILIELEKRLREEATKAAVDRIDSLKNVKL
jgi:hypothetical protein